MQHARRAGAIPILLASVLALGISLAAQTFPSRPLQREFIVDEANLISPPDREQIKRICARLLEERQIPIVVVTIPSLAKYGGLDVESYALGLFNNWGIGPRQNSQGILLLVSVGDRKARIELGQGYAHTKDDTAGMIMQDIIIPNFKGGDYSKGVLQGVQALDTMARGLAVKAPVEFWKVALFWGLIVLGVFAGISLIRSGKKGWGWALLIFIGIVLVGILFSALRGGGKGGSFGGGSGGGGGATGSW